MSINVFLSLFMVNSYEYKCSCIKEICVLFILEREISLCLHAWYISLFACVCLSVCGRLCVVVCVLQCVCSLVWARLYVFVCVCSSVSARLCVDVFVCRFVCAGMGVLVRVWLYVTCITPHSSGSKKRYSWHRSTWFRRDLMQYKKLVVRKIKWQVNVSRYILLS